MTFAPGSRTRRAAGLAGLLGGVALIVALRASMAGSTTGGRLALPAAPVTTPGAQPTVRSTPVSGRHVVDGGVAQTPYGPVQVQLTMVGARIVDVRALQTPHEASRSVRIAQIATPILRQEVLTAQSARVDTVSGATYTSQGYAESVQYALDHAGG